MKLTSILVFTLGLMVSGSNGEATEIVSNQHSRQQLSHDFYVSVVGDASKTGSAARTRYRQLIEKGPLGAGLDPRVACEANFKTAVCETTASTDQITYAYDKVKCAANSEQHVPQLMALYDETPDRMRPSLCTLDRIFLSDSIPSVAFASSIVSRSGQTVGGYIGMRKETFLSQPSTHDIVSWKEQLAFGGSKQFLANDPKLVQISYDLKMSHLKSDGLFYVLMHELGHLIDFNNSINSSWGSPTEWSELSWDYSNRPLKTATFYLRDKFCYYDCARYLKPTEAKAIYDSLRESAFMTTYSSSNAFEDFAEYWVWYLALEFKNPTYRIEVPGEDILEMNSVFISNPQIKKKLDVIDALWKSTTLKVTND